MKAAGIVVEYNPFHNGHLYHLEQTKQKTGADCVIAVMSGNFLQRGEPAIVSKWARTAMALSAGVDIVIELPYVFAVQSAERFASGAVTLLDAIKCSELCFGSEHGEIAPFLDTVYALQKRKNEYDASIRQAVKKGLGYPQALSEAWKQLHIAGIDLTKPNNILGFSYVKAIVEQQRAIVPQTIPRIASGYHEETFTHSSIASATSVRKALSGSLEKLETIAPYVPSYTKEALANYYSIYGTFHEWERYFSLLKYRLLTAERSELQQIAFIEEGLEYRLTEAVTEAGTFSEFLHAVKTKRYTWTRLQRACAHVLTNFAKQASEIETPTYIRLLGMNENGRRYLQKVKKTLSLPLVTTVSQLRDDYIYAQEKKAVAAYAAIFPEPLRTKAIKEEYATPPLYWPTCE